MNAAIRTGMWIAAFLIAAYVIAALLLWSQQERLLYPAPPTAGPSTGGFQVIDLKTEDGLALKAGYRAPAAGRPTIVYFHGNGADWVSSVVATDQLVPHGYGVLAAEYRGYWGNPGAPHEAGLYRDGRAAIAFLADRGVGTGEIVLIGNSIGSGVATQLATEFQPRALILISPFASLTSLVAEKFRWLPTGLLLRDRYENDNKLKGVDAPTLILHGDADSLIPHAHSIRLAASNSDAVIRIFPDRGHDLAWHEDAEAQVLAFLKAI